MTRRSIGSCLLLIGLTSRATADAPWRLASAQVLSSEQAPPILKLSANGPIAFELLPADEAGVPSSASRVVARLYGVTADNVATLTSLAPFVLTARTVAQDCIVTIELAGLPQTHRLVLRAARVTNELDAHIVAAP